MAEEVTEDDATANSVRQTMAFRRSFIGSHYGNHRRMSVQRLCQICTLVPSVIRMECTQKQQPMIRVEMSTPVRIETIALSRQTDVYDRKSAEFRRHLASEEALRQLEHRKSLSMATAYRTSFMR